MSLTGAPLAVLVSVLAIGALIGILLCRSRTPGRPAVRHILRGLMLLGNQLTAVLLVGVLANDVGNFFPSWTVLLSGGGAPKVVHSARAEPAVIRQVRTPPAGLQRQWQLRGRLELIDIDGPVSRQHAHAYVYLPPQYFQPNYVHKRFAAIELLAGHLGRSDPLLDSVHAAAALFSLIQHRRARPVALIMLSSSIGSLRDTRCTDVPGGPQAETFFATDIPLAISRAYRVTPTGWAAGGFAAGGYCASKLTMLHPEVFSAASAVTGYFHAIRTPSTGDLWGGSAVVRNLSDLVWRLRHLPAPPIRLLLMTGADPRSQDAKAAAQMETVVRAPMQVSIQHLTSRSPIQQALPVLLAWLAHWLLGPK